MTDALIPSNADIRDDEDVETARLDRQANTLLADEGRAFKAEAADAVSDVREGVSSIRQAVREDIEHGRDLARESAERARDTIRDEPIKSALYAVGVGVLIGLLLRR